MYLFSCNCVTTVHKIIFLTNNQNFTILQKYIKTSFTNSNKSVTFHLPVNLLVNVCDLGCTCFNCIHANFKYRVFQWVQNFSATFSDQAEHGLRLSSLYTDLCVLLRTVALHNLGV